MKIQLIDANGNPYCVTAKNDGIILIDIDGADITLEKSEAIELSKTLQFVIDL